MYNYRNTLIEQGSTWVFSFTLSRSYPKHYTLRFIFPEDFRTSKVQCDVQSVFDPALVTRVFPQQNIYDCQNINGVLGINQRVKLSGIINPDYEMNVPGVTVMVLQPNGIFPMEKVTLSNSIQIRRKDMLAKVNIPTLYRNNTETYIYELNMDSSLAKGDYFKVHFTGDWQFNLEDCSFIEGVGSSTTASPYFEASYNKTIPESTLYIKGFSQIRRRDQIAFYVRLKTPLNPSNYQMTITAHRSHGGLVEHHTQVVAINQTTGYIREMRIHPVIQAEKLPVGQTGPIEIVLGLINNLPKTNVLTWGKVVIKITPNLPLPDPALSGVPACYFYGDIPTASACTVDATDPNFTLITAFTPKDFNFQSS